ncbi:hypothetical protein [Streptomyces aurantiogriseus]|uniref:Uncharacterized protein n=1 Tax=Streptomyces aurantiogriseus TaxID=66870 RepID=A0A918FNP3_9ACTN|nr:hypothetical protein [Streptomyces aurantiogriseus]GGR61200.1 hypothetical protein GCM10010251_92420 [Streptomyces aurantiogriseus]
MTTTCRTCVTPINYIDCPTGGWWAHEQHPADEHDAVPAAWVDGDPLMEAIAETVWEHCAGEGTSLIVDDPRNIAATAAAVARRLAAASPVPPPADRAALRDRIADTVTPFLMNFSDEATAKVNAGEVATAVLAVLPEPTNQADEIERMRERRMASLRRADEINNELMEEVQRYAAGTERPVLWSVYNEMHKRALTAEARAAAMERAMESTAADALKHRGCHRDLMAQCLRAERAEAEVKELRRMAAEEQPASTAPLASGLPLVKGNCPACRHASLFLGTGGYPTCANHECPEPDAATTVLEQYANEAHPPTHTWKVESPRRDTWASWGATYDDRDWAAERYEEAVRHYPARPYRLVRATTTYTVEAAHQPDTEPQDAPPVEPHPTEADLRHALAVFDAFHGRTPARPAVGEQPETQEAFIPPAHYRRNDGVDCCVHAIPVGPDSCKACRELADDDRP